MLNMIFVGYFTNEAIRSFTDRKWGWGIISSLLVIINILAAFHLERNKHLCLKIESVQCLLGITVQWDLVTDRFIGLKQKLNRICFG